MRTMENSQDVTAEDISVLGDECLRFQILMLRHEIKAAQHRARIADGAIKLATEKWNKLDSTALMLRLSHLERAHLAKSRDGSVTQRVGFTSIIPQLYDSLKVSLNVP